MATKKRRKKKDTFWREFGIGVVSSMAASIILGVYLGGRIGYLEQELAQARRV